METNKCIVCNKEKDADDGKYFLDNRGWTWICNDCIEEHLIFRDYPTEHR